VFRYDSAGPGFRRGVLSLIMNLRCELFGGIGGATAVGSRILGGDRRTPTAQILVAPAYGSLTATGGPVGRRAGRQAARGGRARPAAPRGMVLHRPGDARFLGSAGRARTGATFPVTELGKPSGTRSVIAFATRAEERATGIIRGGLPRRAAYS
jgi:hypothetical protein